MVHYYYIDHSKQQSSAQSDSSDRNSNPNLPFSCSAEVLHGKFFLFGQAVWIICQLLSKTFFLSFSSIKKRISSQMINFYQLVISIHFDVIYLHTIDQNKTQDTHLYKYIFFEYSFIKILL
jgi:hypothetical protein